MNTLLSITPAALQAAILLKVLDHYGAPAKQQIYCLIVNLFLTGLYSLTRRYWA